MAKKARRLSDAGNDVKNRSYLGLARCRKMGTGLWPSLADPVTKMICFPILLDQFHIVPIDRRILPKISIPLQKSFRSMEASFSAA